MSAPIGEPGPTLVSTSFSSAVSTGSHLLGTVVSTKSDSIVSDVVGFDHRLSVPYHRPIFVPQSSQSLVLAVSMPNALGGTPFSGSAVEHTSLREVP